tara:strand:- start:44 stop:379 length:336 start_codon:yes stop_codon:yes gene_type:complete
MKNILFSLLILLISSTIVGCNDAQIKSIKNGQTLTISGHLHYDNTPNKNTIYLTIKDNKTIPLIIKTKKEVQKIKKWNGKKVKLTGTVLINENIDEYKLIISKIKPKTNLI